MPCEGFTKLILVRQPADTVTGQLSDTSTRGLVMAALWNRAGHYIFILWFLSIFYLSFFLA